MRTTDANATKKHEIVNFAMDSTRWNGFKFRDGDIVIGTWAKSGTTWAQQIVSQLIFAGAEGIAPADLAPWVDMRVMPLHDVMAQVEAQTHRRFLKTHLPADALLFSPQAKYIYVGRDGRDVAWSFYNHLMRMGPELYAAFNDPPGIDYQFQRPAVDARTFFNGWLGGEYYPAATFWPHVQSWWDVRGAANVMLVHFNNLKADLAGEIRRIAGFLDIAIDESRWPAVLEHCSFEYMKKNADSLSENFRGLFEGGLTNFIYKGTNGRWREVLSPAEIERYEQAAKANLTPQCARWLATGDMA